MPRCMCILVVEFGQRAEWVEFVAVEGLVGGARTALSGGVEGAIGLDIDYV